MALIKVNNRGQSSDFSVERGATKNLIINDVMRIIKEAPLKQILVSILLIDIIASGLVQLEHTLNNQLLHLKEKQLVLINLQE